MTTQEQQALADARAFANIHQVTVICYYDEDISPDFLSWCSESTFDIMHDNGQVESSWIFGTIEPNH